MFDRPLQKYFQDGFLLKEHRSAKESSSSTEWSKLPKITKKIPLYCFIYDAG